MSLVGKVMDFHEYWELIPNNEKYENIGQVSGFASKLELKLISTFH